MTRSYKVEKEFEYKNLKCVVVFQKMGHRCGYVGIPESHPLYGKDYNEYLEIKKDDIGDREVSSIFALLRTALDDDERVRIEAYFQCHGGITYTDGGKDSKYPIKSDLWWFGFDCAHYRDGKDYKLAIEYFPEKEKEIQDSWDLERMFPIDGKIRSLEYVEEECKKLADQLAEFM